MSTAAVFLDIEKAFDTTWHSGLLHKSLFKLIAFFCLRILVRRIFCAKKNSVMGSSKLRLCTVYINDAAAAPGTPLALFADDTSGCTTVKQEHRVLCKLQRGLTAVNSCCERWNIKINGGKTRAIDFSRRLRLSPHQGNW
jgi:hypothetical protein